MNDNQKEFINELGKLFYKYNIDTVCVGKADVQPVVRSMWIDCTFYDPCERNWERDFEYKCNNCGHKIHNKPNDDNLFCGHCGAKMDLNEGNGERNF